MTSANCSRNVYRATYANDSQLPCLRQLPGLGRRGRRSSVAAPEEAQDACAFKTEQARHWFMRNLHGADAIAASAKTADMARERVAEYLLATWLEQLRELASRPQNGSTTKDPKSEAAHRHGSRTGRQHMQLPS